MPEDGSAAASAGSDDPSVARSRVIAAIATANATTIGETIESLPADLAGAALEAEVRAAKAVQAALEERAAMAAELAEAKARAESLKADVDAEVAKRKAAEASSASAAAQHQGAVAQLKTEVRAAKGQGPVSSEAEVAAIAQETRINELQAVVVSLQTQLRSSEMKYQQTALELANAKESVGPTIKAMRGVEDELAHAQRMLRTSEASNVTLTNQLAALQQRMAGVAIGETRPPRPAPPRRPTEGVAAPTAPSLQATGGGGGGGGGGAAPPPTMPTAETATTEEQQAAVKVQAMVRGKNARKDLEAGGGGGSVAPSLNVSGTKHVVAAAAAEEAPLPGSIDEAHRALQLERARVNLLKAEVAAVRDECEAQLERQRRGADRGLREMQSEFARLHRSNAEMREAVSAAESRAQGEAGFRRRAEQGWLAAQQSLERTQAEHQTSRVQVGELEGRLAAAEAVRAELEAAKKTIGSLQGKSASDDARLLELLESQKLNSQHVAVAMGHAQQHAASEYERLQAEHAAQHQATATQAQYFRQRADRANSRCGAAAAALAAARSSLESLLSRLVSATSMADLADQSRLLFEVKAALIDIEERLRRPDSGGGGPGGAGGGAGKGGSRRGQAAAAGAAARAAAAAAAAARAWCGPRRRPWRVRRRPRPARRRCSSCQALAPPLRPPSAARAAASALAAPAGWEASTAAAVSPAAALSVRSAAWAGSRAALNNRRWRGANGRRAAAARSADRRYRRCGAGAGAATQSRLPQPGAASTRRPVGPGGARAPTRGSGAPRAGAAAGRSGAARSGAAGGAEARAVSFS